MSRLPFPFLIAVLATVLAAAVLPPVCSAQFFPTWGSSSEPFDKEDHKPVSVGGFLGLGFQTHDAQTTSGGNEIALAGLYAERNLGHLHPGLALRGVSSNGNIGGTLIGPRFSYSYNILHPYAEVLFGPNHITLNGVDQQGVTSEVALGLEIAYARNLRWRVIEFTQGTFTGQPGSHPRSFSTGLVIRVP